MSILCVWVVKSANAMNCLFRFRVRLCNERIPNSVVLRERGILHSFPSHWKLKSSLLKKINSFLFFCSWKKCPNKCLKVAHFIMFKGALWEKILVLRFVERSEKRKLFNSLWPSTDTVPTILQITIFSLCCLASLWCWQRTYLRIDFLVWKWPTYQMD